MYEPADRHPKWFLSSNYTIVDVAILKRHEAVFVHMQAGFEPSANTINEVAGASQGAHTKRRRVNPRVHPSPNPATSCRRHRTRSCCRTRT